MSETAYIYTRVSSKGQVDYGGGLERQDGVCREFLASRGWFSMGCFEEKGVSGTVAGADRPAFCEMLGYCREHGVKKIVVERADRVARDLIESEMIIRTLHEAGIELWSADTGEELVFSADLDPSRKLIRQIMAALAEWDKSTLVKKMRAGRDKVKRETGRCEGRKPYANEQVIALVWDFWDNHAYTPEQIAKVLINAEIPAPSGGSWSRRTVKRIIEREKKNHE